MGQAEALRKTEQRNDVSKGVGGGGERGQVGGRGWGGEKKERERKTKDTKTGLDFSSDSWWKLYKKF